MTHSLEHKVDVAVVLAAATALVTRDEEIVIGVLCVFGGLISGFCGARLFPSVRVDFRTRWVVNFSAAILFGPMASIWVAKQPVFEGYPWSSVVVATAGVIGVCGVSIFLLVALLVRGIFGSVFSRYGIEKDDGDGKGDRSN